MIVKTSELEGAALDWAVAKAVGLPSWVSNGLSGHSILMVPEDLRDLDGPRVGYYPSVNWAQGGPLIEKQGVTIIKYEKEVLARHPDTKPWCAVSEGRDICVNESEGPTPLIAAMRAIVASDMGDEIDVPDVLVQKGEST